jgi:hypothetical protein
MTASSLAESVFTNPVHSVLADIYTTIVCTWYKAVRASRATENMSGRTSLSSDPQEHYALNILTQAAMHTRHSATSGGGFPSGRERHHDSLITNQRNGLEGSTSQSIIDEYNASILSSRDLDALGFNAAPQTYDTYGTLESQLAMAHTDNLRILNAESYDDGRGATRDNRRTSRSKQPVLPFGIADHPRIRLDPPIDDEEHESAPRRKKAKIENGSQDGEEGSKGKTRGRPRVNPKDETAADVSTSRSWFVYGYG